MSAHSDLSSDLTMPLVAREILTCVDALAEGQIGLTQFNRAVLSRSWGDRSAATGMLALLKESATDGNLKQYDFAPLERQLRRHIEQLDRRFQVVESAMPATPPQAAVQDTDPTRDFVTVRHAAEKEDIEPPADKTAVISPAAPRPRAPRPAPVQPAPRSAAPVAPIQTIGPSTVLRGRYVLQDEIGRGGVGTVYRALDRNRAGLPHEQQFVALKVLRDEHARRSEALQALRREFHQAQSLSHPGIVNVFDFDRDNHTWFVTMELLDGEPLGAMLRRYSARNKVPRDTAFRMLRELGDAIAYAHERDVLHMDLKPGNVMVSPQGHVSILDFGLAQRFMAEPWISDHMPLPAAATPTYASGERLVGDLPDVRDDIFSFSCLGYELLAGQHPFGRRSAIEARGEGLKPRRIRGLSQRQWRTLTSGLAWSREDRPASMQELLEGLGLSSPRTAPLRVRSGRPAAGPAVGVGLLLLGTAVALGWTRLPADTQERIRVQAVGTTEAVAQSMETAGRWLMTPLTPPGREPEPVAPPAATPLPTVPSRDTTAEIASADATAAAQIAEIPSSSPAITTPPVIEGSPAEPRASDIAPPVGPSPAAGEGPGTVEFASDTFSVSEADSMARLSVRRRGGAAGAISFDWHTADDSATAGEDYASGSGTQRMAAGQTTATLLIPIVGDAVTEHTELLDVVIEDTTGAQKGSITRVPLIIVDDD